MVLKGVGPLVNILTAPLPRSRFTRLALCLLVVALVHRMRLSAKKGGLVKDLSKVGRKVGEERANDELAEYDVVVVGGGLLSAC